jgi:hypothetical protein
MDIVGSATLIILAMGVVFFIYFLLKKFVVPVINAIVWTILLFLLKRVSCNGPLQSS